MKIQDMPVISKRLNYSNRFYIVIEIHITLHHVLYS